MANETRGGANTITAQLAEQIFVAGLSRTQVALTVNGTINVSHLALVKSHSGAGAP